MYGQYYGNEGRLENPVNEVLTGPPDAQFTIPLYNRDFDAANNPLDQLGFQRVANADTSNQLFFAIIILVDTPTNRTRAFNIPNRALPKPGAKYVWLNDSISPGQIPSAIMRVLVPSIADISPQNYENIQEALDEFFPGRYRIG